MKIKVKFEGGRELEAALADITSAATRKNTARRALRAGAAPILQAWQAATTVLTGHLREDETMGSRLNRRQSRLNRGQKMPVEIYVGTNDPAGLMEEFGNKNQRPKGKLRAAWDRFGGAVALATIGRAMWEDIGKAVKRQERKAARLARKGK